jgi:hypothetical protein
VELSDALGKDIYIIDDDRYAGRDLKAMSIEELEILKLRVNRKITGLSSAIKAKQVEYSAGGEGATKEWFVNHKYALNINQCVLPFINNLIKIRKKETRGLSEYFMDEARACLKPVEYESILQNARREMDLMKGEEGKYC